MPQLIEHIDAIARREQRDVLYIEFHDAEGRPVEFHALPLRRRLIEWLDGEGIGWRPCGDVASVRRLRGYEGRLYVDLPFVLDHPGFRKLQAYLEHPDGRMRFSEATFCVLPLAVAMRNAHHDAPGFWERWADGF